MCPLLFQRRGRGGLWHNNKDKFVELTLITRTSGQQETNIIRHKRQEAPAQQSKRLKGKGNGEKTECNEEALLEQQSVISKTSAFFVKQEERQHRSWHHKRQDMAFLTSNIHVLHHKTAHYALQYTAFQTVTCGILQCEMPFFILRNGVFRHKKGCFYCTLTVSCS